MGCPQTGDGERAAPPRGQPPIFSSCEEEKTGRWAVQKRRTGVAVIVVVQTCEPVPGALVSWGTEMVLPRIWQCESSFEIITRAAAEREAVPCVDHPESKTEASTCGGMLPRFYPCRTHPEEDYQSQLAPTTTTLAFAVKSTRMCRFEPPQAPFFWTVNGPFSLGATQRKWGGSSPMPGSRHI